MNMIPVNLQLPLLFITLLISLPYVSAIWQRVAGITSNPIEKIRYVNPYMGYFERVSSTCSLERRNLTTMASSVRVIVTTGDCLDFEMVTDTGVVFLYVLKKLSTGSMVLDVQRVSASLSSLSLTSVFIVTNVGYAGSLGASLVVDVNHKFLYVVSTMSVTRLDLDSIARPVVRTSVTANFNNVESSQLGAFYGRRLYLAVDTAGAMLDVSGDQLGAPQTIPGLAGNTLTLRSAVRFGRFIVFTAYRDVVGGRGAANLIYVIDGQTGALVNSVDATSFMLTSSLEGLVTSLYSACSIGSVLVYSTRRYDQLLFLTVNAAGSVSFVGQSDKAQLMDLMSVHCTGEALLVSALSGFALERWSTFNFGQLLPNPLPIYPEFQNPLVIQPSQNPVYLSPSVPRASFSVQVWNDVLNYTFLTTSVSIKSDIPSSLWSLKLKAGGQIMDLTADASVVQVGGSALSAGSLDLFSLQSSFQTGVSYSITLTASDGRVGQITSTVTVSLVDRVPTTTTTGSGDQALPMSLIIGLTAGVGGFFTCVLLILITIKIMQNRRAEKMKDNRFESADATTTPNGVYPADSYPGSSLPPQSSYYPTQSSNHGTLPSASSYGSTGNLLSPMPYSQNNTSSADQTKYSADRRLNGSYNPQPMEMHSYHSGAQYTGTETQYGMGTMPKTVRSARGPQTAETTVVGYAEGTLNRPPARY